MAIRLGYKVSIELKILDLGKPNSYTETGRYVVVINNERQFSGNTEQEALEATAIILFKYMKIYKNDLRTLTDKLQPVVDYLKPDEGDDRL